MSGQPWFIGLKIGWSDVARAVHNVDAHVHREAATTRGQIAYPVMALSEAALGAYDANKASYATGSIKAEVSDHSVFLPSANHLPPQSPQQSLETPREEVCDQHLQAYRISRRGEACDLGHSQSRHFIQ